VGVVGKLGRPHPSMKGGASMGPVTWLRDGMVVDKGDGRPRM
jgi:hypothetical protein